MKMIGLTGGIGSGKSTVAEMLRQLGAYVIDADEAARAVVEPGTTGLEKVVAEFGREMMKDGGLDRPRLAALVFNDADAREKLNAIVHPLVRDWVAQRVAEAAEKGVDVVVQDVPLLFENGLGDLFESTILVYVPPAVQMERLVARGVDEADARARIDAQLPIDEKTRLATYVIDNTRTRDATRDQVGRIWTEITASRLSGP